VRRNFALCAVEVEHLCEKFFVVLLEVGGFFVALLALLDVDGLKKNSCQQAGNILIIWGYDTTFGGVTFARASSSRSLRF